MARVYKVPHYTDVIAAKACLLSGFKKGRLLDNAIYAACDEDYASLRAECDELDPGSKTESSREDAVAMVAMREGIDRVMSYANANTDVYHENGWSFQDILCVSNAVSYMYEGAPVWPLWHHTGGELRMARRRISREVCLRRRLYSQLRWIQRVLRIRRPWLG